MKLSGSVAAGKGEPAHSGPLLERDRERALGGGLPRRVWIVVDDDAAREPVQQLYLWLGEARAAARDHVRDTSARHGNSVHVSLNQHGEVALPQRFLRAIEMVKDVALR